MTIPAIRVENLGKRYLLHHASSGRSGYKTFRESLSNGAVTLVNRVRGKAVQRRMEEFWALKEVTFDVRPGEIVGIIGRNGAGKSTLLKILSRITKPSTGHVEICGRVGSLLEVGTGFHPELTGRENIFLNGSILGMSRREISRKFDEIVAFADVERFLDTPVKRYSSGMYVRLAFAVAAHLEPELLIVDEVLAVGDQAFQKKCTQRMSEVSREGRTILLVSHDIPMVTKLSTRVLWMNSGAVHMSGPPAEVIDRYYEFSNDSLIASADVDLAEHPNRRIRSSQVLSRLRVVDSRGDATTVIRAGGSVTFDIQLNTSALSYDQHVGIDLCDVSGTPLGEIATSVHTQVDLTKLPEGRIICRIPFLPLIPGEYQVNVWVWGSNDLIDMVPGAIKFTVAPDDYFGTGRLPNRRSGPLLINATWTIPGADDSLIRSEGH
jgi:lipopolysaccharide transport system ATP-binding protein